MTATGPTVSTTAAPDSSTSDDVPGRTGASVTPSDAGHISDAPPDHAAQPPPSVNMVPVAKH
jgi:hypothetical protein